MKAVHERLHHPFESWVFTDHVLKKVEEEREASSRFVTAPSSRNLAKVYPPEGVSHVLNWTEGTGTCLRFQDCGYPWCHALAMTR
jgi:hypothetical protein